MPRETAPQYTIPLHTVMKITWDGWTEPKEEVFELGPSRQQVARETGLPI